MTWKGLSCGAAIFSHKHILFGASARVVVVQFGTMGKKGKKKKAGKLSKGDRKRAIADLEVKLEARPNDSRMS